LVQATLCYNGDPTAPRGKEHSSPYFSIHVCCGQTVAHLINCWLLLLIVTVLFYITLSIVKPKIECDFLLHIQRFLALVFAVVKYCDKCSAVAEIGDRLATVDIGQKLGAVPLFRGSWVPHLTQCRLDQGYLRTKLHLDPCSRLATRDRIGRKVWGCAPLLRGMGPHLTQCGLSQGLPPYQVAS